jgi:hypothetical protein
MVSLLGLPLPASTASNDPRRNASSGGRDGDVIMSEGPSPASANSLRRADPGMGDDPERVRSGILVNLIWLAGLAIRQFSSRGVRRSPTFASRHLHRSRR